MAEFALGLTKMAVEGTVSRVKLAIEEEQKLRVRVENDLVFITGEFQMMQSFLKMANVKGAKNEVVRTWLRQVRDLAFDVEDCIEFVVHLDKKSPWAWLRRLGRMVVSCNAPPLPLDKAVADIGRLKARVEDVSQRNTRYNLIGGDDSGSGSNSKAVSMQASPGAAAAAFRTLKEVWEVTGKWRSTGDLQKLVMGEGSDLQVISVWGNTSTGSADFGTASLFSKMYNDTAICQEFRTRAWVKLVHPFNPDEFLKCLLTQLYASSRQTNIDMDFWTRMKAAVAEEDGINKAKLMQEVMSTHKYLIVLEEVFSVVDWNVIKLYLPDSENGSRIIVSTKQLEVALLCTGKPYQVSELKQLSDDQSLCAFSKKYGRRSGMGELIWQIRCRGVISVFGAADIKTTLVNEVYTRIVHKWKQFEGVEFERDSWVDVPIPFNLEVFSRRLLLGLCSEDHVSKQIAAIRAMGDPCLSQECCKFLHEHDCLVVINGLQSTHDWDSIKAAFLSEPTKGCILVITNEASVATHCVQEEGAVLNMEDMNANVRLRPLLKGYKHCERGGVEPDDRGRPFSVRREQAREWFRQLGRAYLPEMNDLELSLQIPGVISLWGAGAGKSALVRHMYYRMMVTSEASWESGYGKQTIDLPDRTTKKFSWVDVPHPFNLTEFSCRLLLDFHSDDHRSKKTAALSMMEGGEDQIEECCKFLSEYRYLVVIDGIQSTHDWDTIKVSFLSKPMKGYIVVITDEATVATYCVNHEEDRVIEVNNKDLHGAPSPLVKDFPSHLFSDRRGEARNWTNKYRLLGHQNESAHRFACSLSRSGPSATSVWGIAGIGKSTVVRSVYCHLMLGVEQYLKQDQFGKSSYVLVWSRPEFTMYSWADVPHPFNLADLSWRLLRDFYSHDLNAKSTAAIDIMEGRDPIQECRRFLREHRCLVVIDGLRSKDHWELIKAAFVPDSTKASIVVITNEESVASHCVDNKKSQLINIKGLEADTAVELFQEINRGRKELRADAMELAKLIMVKCGGIPRVIVTIAEMIAECGKRKIDTRFLKNLNDDFMGSLEIDTKLHWVFEKIELHNFRGLLSWMESYFDACSDSLKPCIFYLSIFPAGHNIRRKRLLRRWIAECYSRDTSRGTVEENGEKLISELVDLSIIQHKTSKVLCQVNGFFHEYIISRPLDDNLVFTLEGNCSLNSERVGQHLAIRSSWDRDITVFTSMDLSRLRSLTVFGTWMPFFISTDMRLLRVLDLEDASGITVDDLEQIGKVLPRLKFLSVRGCKEISRLPESLCGLRQLQTLDVRHTSIAMLPPAIVKLKKLQYVRAGNTMLLSSDETASSLPEASIDRTLRTATPLEDGDGTATTLPAQTGGAVQTSTPSANCMPRTSSVSSWLSKFCRTRQQLDNGGVKVPAAIGKLAALHTLGVVDVNVAGGKAILKELKKLTQLRKLGVCAVSRENWHGLCSVISGHAHLKSLSVQLNKDKEGVYARLDDVTKAPKTLNSLKLYGQVQILPSWIMHHENLQKGNLEMTVVRQEDIGIIEKLRCGDIFHRLCVKPIEDGELRVGKLEDGSQRPGWSGKKFKVRILEIDCNCRLQITCGNWVLMFVELLIVRCSSGSSLQVSGLKYLGDLKEVWLKGSYGDELKEDLQRQIDEMPEGWEKPVLKLEEAQPHSS